MGLPLAAGGEGGGNRHGRISFRRSAVRSSENSRADAGARRFEQNLGKTLLAGAIGAGAEKAEHVGDVLVAAIADEAFESVEDTEIERFDFVAGCAEDMVMMIGTAVDFVESGSFADVREADEAELFEKSEAAVNGCQIADSRFEPVVNLFDGDRFFLVKKNFEDRFSRIGDPHFFVSQTLERRFQSLFGIGRNLTLIIHNVR